MRRHCLLCIRMSSRQIYFYMPRAQDCPILIPASTYEQSSVAYIDLDLPAPSHVPPTPSVASSSALADEDACTAYKKIDEVRTKAFNKTRNKVEERYKNQD